MIRILVNDGIHSKGKNMLEAAAYNVETNKVEQGDLTHQLPSYDAIVVRSATKVRKELIDQCPKLKVIARGGVGLDNIDVDYARSKGIEVINTPAASSRSVAELAFAHMMSLARSVHRANRKMPAEGATQFKTLKKQYSKGFELKNKTLGIIGLGRIGQETAKIALGMGMRVLPVDLVLEEVDLNMHFLNDEQTEISITLKTVPMGEMLSSADIITLHVPGSGKPIIGKAEFEQMKKGVILLNTSRGGSINEAALLDALRDGIVAGAGLDVFENEPSPQEAILQHPSISLSPHIGASTEEAQANIGVELAEKIIAHFDKN